VTAFDVLGIRIYIPLCEKVEGGCEGLVSLRTVWECAVSSAIRELFLPFLDEATSI
jgi:hypothetical protein